MSHILLNVRFYFRSQDVADADSTVGFPVVDDPFPVGGTVRAVGPVMHRAAVLPRRVCVYTYNLKLNNNIPNKILISLLDNIPNNRAPILASLRRSGTR